MVFAHKKPAGIFAAGFLFLHYFAFLSGFFFLRYFAFLLGFSFLRLFSSYDNLCLLRVYFILLHNQFFDCLCGNPAGGRVHHTVNLSRNVGIHTGILERQRGIDKLAVFHHQIVNVTKSLQTFNSTVDKRQILRIPAQVFPGNKGVVNRYVFTVPERILGKKSSRPSRAI